MVFSRRFLFCLLTVLLFANGSSNSQSNWTKYDFYITLQDGVQLDCTKFIPNTPPPPKGYPCTICCHGFGLSKEDNFRLAEDQAAYGTYALCYSMRGQGNSGGYSNLISTTEMNDLMQIIQYVKDDANTNDDRIAVTGGSQGGIIPFMAACYGANIRCLVTELASPEFASDWIANGCVKMTLLWSLSYDNSVVRYNDEVSQYRQWTVSDNREDWNKLAYNLPLNRDFIGRVKDSHVPMLISNTWQDKFFNSEGMIKIVNDLKAPYRMYFGAVLGHGGDVSADENEYHAGLVDKWFRYWLNDIQDNVLKEGRFIYASTSNDGGSISFTRFESPVWPPEGTRNVKFYLASGDRLSATPNNDASASYTSFQNDVTDPNMTLLNAVYMSFTGPAFDSKFRKDEIKFDSEPLDRDYKMVGAPQAELFYSSDANVCQYDLQIWQIFPDGTEDFVTCVDFTDRDYSPNDLREKLIDGEAYSHIFRKGSRIRLVVTNLDTRPDDKFLRTYPFVLPVLAPATNKIYMTTDKASYISVPLM